jgi:hypothetical protein
LECAGRAQRRRRYVRQTSVGRFKVSSFESIDKLKFVGQSAAVRNVTSIIQAGEDDCQRGYDGSDADGYTDGYVTGH